MKQTQTVRYMIIISIWV